MAMTFHGDDAETKAQQLVYELRKQYKLNAYSVAKLRLFAARTWTGGAYIPMAIR